MSDKENDKLTSKGAILVAVFLLVGLFAVFAEDSKAAQRDYLLGVTAEPYLELGHTFANSQLTVGGAGLRLNDKWDIHVGLMGEGYVKNDNYQNQVFFYSISRVISPKWYVLGGEFKQRLGVAKTNDFILIGNNNYRLGLILNYRLVELEYFHYSSANINDVNTGVDGVSLRVFF